MFLFAFCVFHIVFKLLALDLTCFTLSLLVFDPPGDPPNAALEARRPKSGQTRRLGAVFDEDLGPPPGTSNMGQKGPWRPGGLKVAKLDG